MSARILAAFFLIIGLNLVFVGSSFFLAYQSSQKDWNGKIEKKAQETLDVMFSSITEGEATDLTEEICQKNILKAQQRLIGMAQLLIYDKHKNLVCHWLNSSLDNYTPPEPDNSAASPYYFNNEIIGYYILIPVEFRHFDENRQFISRIIHMALGGMIFSFFVSLWLAFRIAGHFAGEAKEIAINLMNLSEGYNNFEITPSSTTEMMAINDAALLLQKKMIQQEGQRNSWYKNITHDLRTPITALKSQFIACRDGILPMTPERWETILSELAGMELMIRDFALLSKLESSNFKLTRQFISTPAIKEHLVITLTEPAREKEIELEWDFMDFSFLCDFSLITTAFTHLIENAIEFSLPGSTIEIRMGVLDKTGYFRVIPRGQLEREQLERIFDPLYKADFSRKTKGSGLGLTISRKISEILGAELKVENLNDNRISFEMLMKTCSSSLNV